VLQCVLQCVLLQFATSGIELTTFR